MPLYVDQSMPFGNFGILNDFSKSYQVRYLPGNYKRFITLTALLSQCCLMTILKDESRSDPSYLRGYNIIVF